MENTASTQNKNRVVIYLDKATIQSVDDKRGNQQRSVYLRTQIESISQSNSSLDEQIKIEASKQVDTVIKALIGGVKSDGANTLNIPESLVNGVKKWGYDDPKAFINDAINMLATKLENR